MGLAAFNRMRRLQAEKEKQEKVKEPVIEEYETFERAQLKKVNNDLLKARLDQLEIEYASNAVKKDLIDLLIGEEETPLENNTPDGNEDNPKGKKEGEGELDGEENKDSDSEE